MKKTKILMLAGALATSLGVSAISAEIETSNTNYPRLTYKDTQMRSLNFLSNKYKQNKKVMSLSGNLEIKPMSDEEIGAGFEVDKKQSPLDIYFNTFKEVLSQKVYNEYLYWNTGLTAENIRRVEYRAWKDLLDSLPESKETKLIRSLILTNEGLAKDRTMLNDIVIGGQFIHHIVNTNGAAPVLFLGRSPSFLKLAYDMLNPNNSITLSFSGTPDMENIRGSSFYQNSKDEIIARNLVTKEKLDFYCNYMTSKGMDKVTDKLYLVDIIGRGGGLNSFMNVARYYYLSHLKRESMPEVHFIGIDLAPCKNRVFKKPNGSFYNYDFDNGSLWFEEDKSINLIEVKMRATPLIMNCITTKFVIDNDTNQEVNAENIEFPAIRWTPKSNDLLAQGGRLHKKAYEYVKAEMEKIIKIHSMLKERL